MTSSPDPDDTHLSTVREELLEQLLHGDEMAAVQLVLKSLENGARPQSLLLDVLGETQREVGRRWQSGQITLVEEHAASALTERLASVITVHPAARSLPPVKGPITVACAEGEWHALPSRLAADVLRINGWKVVYLGSDVEVSFLARHLATSHSRLLGISCQVATHLPMVHAAIKAATALGIPTLTGGAAFDPQGVLSARLGAAAHASDPRHALTQLQDGIVPLSFTLNTTTPHVPCEEYHSLNNRREAITRAVAVALHGPDAPPVEPQSPPDLLTRFLLAALYTDEPSVLTHALLWLGTAPDQPDETAYDPTPALQALTVAVHDHPTALRLLQEATASTTGDV
ncbi:B12-binding domain-containing protein [Streptomyces sp. NPDC090106]|uniref:cobalamin B12-binding domain-containing protein n=1 Tax=Streptomyces sp. NPDC090106 TaxID=3365946 RepID=UPI00381B1957